MDQKFPRPTGQNCVVEASRLANFLIDVEKRGGADIQLAIHLAERKWGFDPHTLYRLRYKHRELEDVKASTLEALRWAYEQVYEKQRHAEEVELEVAAIVESRRHDSLI